MILYMDYLQNIYKINFIFIININYLIIYKIIYTNIYINII